VFLTEEVGPLCGGENTLEALQVRDRYKNRYQSQRHESTQLEALLDAIRVPCLPGAAGRPRKRSEHLIADKG
jgi:hypothetical protein